MKHTAAAASASHSRSSRNGVSFEEGMRLRVAALLAEREILQEEVRQLRAAVHIYTEVLHRLEVDRRQHAA